jgi:hypothetical protein
MKHRRSSGSEENLSEATGMMMFDNVKFVFLVKLGMWDEVKGLGGGRGAAGEEKCEWMNLNEVGEEPLEKKNANG